MAEKIKSSDWTKQKLGQDIDDIIYIAPATPPTVVVDDSDSDSNNSWKSNQTEDTRACNNEIKQINGFSGKSKSESFPSATSIENKVEPIILHNQMKFEIEDDEKLMSNSEVLEYLKNKKQNNYNKTYNDDDSSSNESDKTSPLKTNPLAIHIDSDEEDEDEGNYRSNNNAQNDKIYSVRSISPTRLLYMNSEQDYKIQGKNCCVSMSPSRVIFITSQAEDIFTKVENLDLGGDDTISNAMLERILSNQTDIPQTGRVVHKIPIISNGSISETEKDIKDNETISHNLDGDTINKYSRKVIPKKLTCLNCGAQGHKTCDCTVPFKIACDLCGAFDNYIRCNRCWTQCDTRCYCTIENNLIFCSNCKMELKNKTVIKATGNPGNNNTTGNNISSCENNNNDNNNTIPNDSIGVKKKGFEKTIDDAEDAYYLRPKPNLFSRNNEGYSLARKSKSFPKNYHKRSHEKALSQPNINSLKTSDGISENSTLNNIKDDEEEDENIIRDSPYPRKKARGYFNRSPSLSITSGSDDIEILEVENHEVVQEDTNQEKEEEEQKKEITYVLSSEAENEALKDNPSQSPKENPESQAGLIVIDSECDINVEASCSQPIEQRSKGSVKYTRILPTKSRYSSTSSDSDDDEAASNIQKKRRKRINPLAIVIDDSDYDGDDDTPPSKSPVHKTSLPLKKRKTNFQRRLSVDRADGIQMGIDVDNTISGQYPTFVPNIKRGPAIEKFNSY